MMRQISKQILTNLARSAQIVMFMGTICVASTHGAGAAPLVQTIVTDALTGVAIDGYDPVSYFTDERPLPGRPEFEYSWGGVPWYFDSKANLDVFRRAPEVYVPQFGGYGLMGVARGYLSEGNPNVYSISAGRLFLFYSVSNRDAFFLSQRKAYKEALENWVVLSKDLAGS